MNTEYVRNTRIEDVGEGEGEGEGEGSSKSEVVGCWLLALPP